MAAIDLLNRGGSVMWVLLAVSVLSLSLILYKVFQFRLARLSSCRLEETLSARLQKENPASLAAELATERSPVARIAGKAIELHEDTALGEEAIKEELERLGGFEVRELESHLKTIGNIAHLSPLLGLLGTVTGMIAAFHSLESAGMKINPSLLAGGIWEALLTTAFGLTIAIPTMGAYALLDAQVDRAIARMKDITGQILLHYNRKRAGKPISAGRHANGNGHSAVYGI